MKYFLIVLILRFFEISVIEQFEGNTQILIWNVLLLLQPFLLSLGVNQVIKDKKLKIVNFVVILTSFVMLSNFVIEWTFYENIEYVRNIFNILIFVFIIPLSANAVIRTLTPESAEYDEKKSYIVLKKPCDLYGLLASLITAPYGHYSLVTKAKWFKFKRGVMQEMDYIHNKDYCLLEIGTVRLSQARQLLGLKWSLVNNCFVIFNKFRK